MSHHRPAERVHAGLGGNAWVRTPHMESLAAEGVRFTHAYCANPVCLPSRFSLLTGLYPGSVAVRSNDYTRESPGLPETIIPIKRDLFVEAGKAEVATCLWAGEGFSAAACPPLPKNYLHAGRRESLVAE